HASGRLAGSLQCSNQLKQIGVAIHGFHAAQNGLPPSRMPCHHGSWVVALWPYLEQESLNDRWGAEESYYHQSDETRAIQIATFYCPSRRSPGGVSKDTDRPSDHGGGGSANVPGALGDYASVAGSYVGGSGNGLDWARASSPNKPNGCFQHAGAPFDPAQDGDPNNLCRGTYPFWLFDDMVLPVKFSMVTDGLSHTLFVGERHVPEGTFGTRAGQDGSIYNSDHVQYCCARLAGPGYTLARSPSEPFVGSRATFGGPHPGICQFLFGDGSVRSLLVSIDTVILGNLANRHDGQPIPSDALEN
ncbi:MAG: DUF1559 domain-containing protein, partial [Planctomycetota bacterium]|nr:DUF1559 domain-containing protein [Planctomycetota bacterium]